jgi:hypothetical protein
MFVTLEREKPGTENKRGLNLDRHMYDYDYAAVLT